MRDFEKTNLPVGWVKTDVDTVSSDIVSGSGFPKEHQGETTGEYPFAKVGTISKVFRAGHKTMNSADNYISENIRVKIKAKTFPKGTIVFPKIGEALKGNYRVITSREMIFDNNVMGIVPDSRCIYGDYFYYFLTTKDFGEFAVATAVPSVRRGDVANISIPLPPLPEQRRIVAKIEELLSELDKGIESFKTAREQLKVYRQALLKHAFEGKLTAKWREENKGKLETADLLLKRIQAERAERYRQQVKEWETAVKGWEKGGKKGSKPGKPSQPKQLPPLTAEELAELPKLPKRWGWVKLQWISDVSGGLTKNQKRNTLPNKLPFLRVANVYFNRLELDEMHEIGLNNSEIDRVLLQKGDLLIVEGNGSVEQIGRVAIWNGIIANCVHQNHLIKTRTDSFANTKYLLYFLMSELGRKFIIRAASSTSGLHTLSISKVEGLFIPLCHIEEQTQVLIELDDKLSAFDQLDQTITTALQQAESLCQSILKKAFSGQLVPQDPDDEPASKLLARIKAERDTHTTKSTIAKKATTRMKKADKV
jgi:type I restriction enzyme S subunit